MKSFKFFTEEFLAEEAQMLMEKLITFGGKAYPKFGNVVIMAGGAGSGKGFVQDRLVGLEGKSFDPDELKKLAGKSTLINKRVKDEFGVDLKDLGTKLRVPENVSKLHEIIGDALNLPNRKQAAFFGSVMTAAADRKPNIIFDTTLKDAGKLQKLSRQVTTLGYDKKNIHIVWVVNDIEIAKKQNLERPRVVPTEILINTHRGASNTMGDILKMGETLRKYMDGDLVFAFNKIGVDSEVVTSRKGGSYVKEADYVYIKRAGKSLPPLDKLNKAMLAKVKSYVPKNIDWENLEL
jgi:predicted kinase